MLEVTTIGSHAGRRGLIFYQDVTPGHVVRVCKQTVLGSLKHYLIPKLSRFKPAGLSRLRRHAGKVHKLRLKSKTIDELKVALQTIWEELPQEHINKVVVNFTKCLTACMAANGGHFEHLQ